MALFRKKKSVVIEEVEHKEISKEELDLENGDLVKTSLVFHPEWEIAPQEKYIYHFHHQQLPGLKPNQISISGIKLEEYDNDLYVIAFLRNTLEKPVRFETVSLLILDENSNPIAKQEFEMDDLGEIPSMSCMPWRFLFTEDERLTDKVPSQDNWKIAFELKKREREEHALDLAESWKSQLSMEQKEQLAKLVSSLPQLSLGEVNFMGIETKWTPENNLAVTLLIRNGSNKNIKLEQIPLIVEDATGDIIAQGGFKLEDFEVLANTSKPWTFIFPSELIAKSNPDLSTWKVYPPKQS
ncbi:accessory Sec system S-layer assembly protein [Bacillus sp. 31A1R]|uniref:Accessory Sec system S-layer assembly protein n=1 Tax=Robertmurraya mangrovi TaxID=3098077 RepID=A0ABU5IXS4_9BACI|nr:accessory Sec system S-layer assembly protein [Bacillus sp. 31A1R]MDZ5471916.1 accessory Sec system S-layer assembly protein [Bacillus sp. 31A1R]